MPLLIVLRIVRRYGWSNDTVGRLLVQSPGSRYRTSAAGEIGVALDTMDNRAADSTMPKNSHFSV